MPQFDTTITVEHGEMPGSPSEAYEDEQYVGTRVLTCAWGDALTLINQVMGNVTGSGTGSTGGSHTRGQIFPLRAGETNPPRASGYSLEPFDTSPQCNPPGSPASVATYKMAQITFTYTRMLFEEPGEGNGGQDVLIEETIEPEAEVISVKGKALGWQTNFGDYAKACEQIDAQEVPGRLIASMGWILTFHRVISFAAAFIDLLGYINAAPVASTKFSKVFEARTLLYTAFTASRRFFVTGAALWTMTTRFSYRRNMRQKDNAILGWNGFWRAGADDFDRICPVKVRTSPDSENPTFTPTNPAANVRECGDPLGFYPEGDFSMMSLQVQE